MGKLSDLIAAETKPAGGQCVTCLLLKTIPKPEAADLAEALNDCTVTATSIARALAALGHKVGSSSLQRHRRGDCGRGQAS